MLFQFIPTKVHGILDYLTAAMLPVLPRVLGYDRTVTHLHDALAATTLAAAATTDYELGMVRVLPMKAHLALDTMTGLGLIVAGAAMDEEGVAPRTCLTGLGLYYVMAGLCTKTQPEPRGQVRPMPAPMQGDTIERYAAQVRPEASGAP